MKRQSGPLLNDADEDGDGDMAHWGHAYNHATRARNNPWMKMGMIAAAVVLVLALGNWSYEWYNYGRDVCAPAHFGGMYVACAITDPRPVDDDARYAQLRGLPIVAPRDEDMQAGAFEIALRGFRAHVGVAALEWALRNASRNEVCACAVDFVLPVNALGINGKVMFSPRFETATAVRNTFRGMSASAGRAAASRAAEATGFLDRDLHAPHEARVTYETPGGTVTAVVATALETACIVWCDALTRHVVQ